MEVREALEEYVATIHQSVQPKTLSEKKRMIGYFVRFCEEQHIQLEDVKPKTIATYLDHLAASHHAKKGGPLSTHTIFLHIASIKIFLNWCSQEEEFEEHVKPRMVARIPNPRKAVLIKDVFSKKQVQALLAACEEIDVGIESVNAYLRDRNRAIIYLLLDTGIRAAELCGLRMKYVWLDRDDPHIRVYGKGDKFREVGLGNRSREELTRFVRKYRAKGKGTDAFLFRSRQGPQLLVQTLFRSIARLGEEAGIKGVRCSPHTFRHTYAVTFVQCGGDVYKLSKLLGHHSVKATENYLKSFTQQDARRDAVSPVDTAF